MAREEVSEFFFRDEIECHGLDCCNHSYPISSTLLKALDVFRAKVNEPVFLSCAFRCLKHNKSIGSTDTSQHPRGYAADVERLPTFTIEGMSAVAESIPEFSNGGIGLYKSFIHLDVRDLPARWDSR